MARSLAAPPRFRVESVAGPCVTLVEEEGGGTARVLLFVLEDAVVRLLVLPSGSLRGPPSYAIAPGECDVAETGRARLDTTGFSCPPFSHSVAEGALVVETARIRVTAALKGLFCKWEQRPGPDGAWTVMFSDRRTQAYDWGWWADDGSVSHFVERLPGERYLGLGEVSGELDRAGRRIRLASTDAMGYCARTADPLYKHIPFFIASSPKSPGSLLHGPAHGVFYDTLADAEFDFGAGLSNYHSPYRSFVARGGDLDVWVLAGPRVADVSRRFTWLTGRPALPPAWSVGYSGSSMAYTDAPDAFVRLRGFVKEADVHGVPCSSFHLSSGYTSGPGGRRYVFRWNADKFPVPAALFSEFAAAGVALIPNIKPCLLTDHPEYSAAAAAGILVRAPAAHGGTPHVAQFWGALGSYIDFTAPGAAAWWREHVASALIAHAPGLPLGIWCDNNEFEGLQGPLAEAVGFGSPLRAELCKPAQTCLMVRASTAALQAAAPGKRPFVVSRAGFAGMQRYAQTWSGDNTTSWASLRYCLRMGLGLALSGVANAGHDVGGFAGPCPGPELLVRWVEAGIFLPRFSIHSWNDDGSVTEPWTHPGVTPLIAALIRLRARLAPYLYDLLWASHERFEPILRPTLAEFEDDPETAAPCDEAMLGPALLLAPVVEAAGGGVGAPQRAVYLPAGAAWYALGGAFDPAAEAAAGVAPGAPLPGGRRVTVPAPLGVPPLFGRAGSIVALDETDRSGRGGGRLPAQRAFWVFPALCAEEEGGGGGGPCTCARVEYESAEDDGESVPGHAAGAGVSRWHVLMACNGRAGVAVSVRRGDGCCSPAPATVSIITPPDFQRPVTVVAGGGAAAAAAGGGVGAIRLVSDSGLPGARQPAPYDRPARVLVLAMGRC